MNTKEHLKKEHLLVALTKSLGIVSNACEIANISRTTYYKYYNSDEQFKEQVKSIGDEAIDFVESQLFELIKNGNVAATIFFLKKSMPNLTTLRQPILEEKQRWEKKKEK